MGNPKLMNRRRKKTVTSIESLPNDMVAEVLGRVASSSIIDLFSAQDKGKEIRLTYEAGETSGGTNRETELEDWLISLDKGDIITNRPKMAKIPLVPSILRNVESDKICYDPHIVSIGPYHHGKPGLEQGEDIKIKMTLQFIKSVQPELTSSDIFHEVMGVFQEAKAYYVECYATTRFKDTEFMKLMFLDGCFLIQYMVSIAHGFIKELKVNTQLMALITRDLLLVENQLPFIVLKAIADVLPKLYFSYTHANSSFLNIIYDMVWKIHRDRFNPFMQSLPIEANPLHLLDIFRKIYVGPKPTTQKRKYDKLEVAMATFRSAKELETIGFSFKNHSRFSTDIYSDSGLFFPHISLPQIVIDESTKDIFLNMIAYEMGNDDDLGDYRVNNFICFMDSLIDHADDVQLLRSCGILHNALGSDEQVAYLFNHIANNLIPSPDAYIKDFDASLPNFSFPGNIIPIRKTPSRRK